MNLVEQLKEIVAEKEKKVRELGEEIKNLRLSVGCCAMACYSSRTCTLSMSYVVVLSQKAQMDSIGPLFENAQSVSHHTSEMEVTSDKNDELEDFGTMTPPPHATYACSKISGKPLLLDDETHYSFISVIAESRASLLGAAR